MELKEEFVISKSLWGGEDVGIMNDESLMVAIKASDKLKNAGAWFTLRGLG